jgi:hypothetical protein
VLLHGVSEGQGGAFSRRDEERFARFVSMAEIEASDFDLNIARYLDSSDVEDVQGIDGHLRGGIPNRDLDALSPYWDVFPAAWEALVGPALRPGYSVLCVKPDEVADAVYGHDEFAAFNRRVTSIFEGWCDANRERLRGLTAATAESGPGALAQRAHAVLEMLHGERFVDASPAATYATLLDEGTYLASERTMDRILAAKRRGP